MRPLNPQSLIDGAHMLVGIAPATSYDLAFVHHVGWQSHRLGTRPQSAWPFPMSTNHEEMAEMARSHGLAVERPQAGDIVLYWSEPLLRHVHAAIVVGLLAESLDDIGRATFQCTTIEGTPPRLVDADTVAHPSALAREVEAHICPRKGDLLVRWTLCDDRQAALDSRRRKAAPRAAAPWAFDEQLARCA